MKSSCVVAGHRGFKGKHTENTLHGFQRCFQTGASVFETDVWTTKDGVLVISHDVNTKRVFCDENGGETDYNILDTNYDQLKKLRTIGSGEPLLTFQDVLHWFLQYVKNSLAGKTHKIMLDVKNANPPVLLRLLFADMLAVHDDLAWWFPRIQIGLWSLRFLKYLNQDQYFQELFHNCGIVNGFSCFDIYHISLSWQDSMVFLAYNEYLDTLEKARIKFKIAGVSLIHVSTWTADFLDKFMPAVKIQDLKLYTWTINRESQLRYFCSLGETWRLSEYGIITDFPDKMVEYLSRELWPQQGSLDAAKIPTSFMIFAWLVKVTMYWAKPVQSSLNTQFETRVAPEETLSVKPKLTNKIFALLQAWGLF